jgi:hypothetical protein
MMGNQAGENVRNCLDSILHRQPEKLFEPDGGGAQ